MKRIAIVAGLALLAACSKTDKNAMDTTSAAGMVAPVSDSMGAMGSSSTSGSMSSGSSMSGSAADSSKMSGSSMGGSNMSTPAPDHKTGGAMGGDSAGMGGSHGAMSAQGDTLKKKPPTR